MRRLRLVKRVKRVNVDVNVNLDFNVDFNVDVDFDSLSPINAIFFLGTRIARISRMFEVFDLLRGGCASL